MKVSDFDFELPAESIALRPAEPRGSARLLVVGPGGALGDEFVRNLHEFLRPGDLLVFNDTRVLPVRLQGRRGEGGRGRVEATLHKQIGPQTWRAFTKPARKCKIGDVINFNGLQAIVKLRGEGGELELEFLAEADALIEVIERQGEMPLPPYIATRRAPDARDRCDYQTVYAARDGAVAAPTAGLHFTEELLSALAARGVEQAFVTLHVGAGTFLPVKAEDTKDHRMHAEWGEVTADVAACVNRTRAGGGRIVAVGTTALRLLESAVDEKGVVVPFSGETDIFITPGYSFRAVDLLLTNFHLPKSTLFMLVAAFSGLDHMKKAYAHAVDSGYRFYSYGDACLLFPEDGGA